MKTIGIHQPNFMPWMGYFNKIYKSDCFVIIDNVQYTKGNVCNRNKIKNEKGEAIWITVPVKPLKGLNSTFNEVVMANDKWQSNILQSLKQAYKTAPYFGSFYPEIEVLLNANYSTLASLNIALIKYFCEKLKLTTPIYRQSEIGIDFGKRNDLTLGITKYFLGDVYLSGQGAKKYNDHDLFEKNGVTIQYQEFHPQPYNQLHGPFIEKLSIVDLLFNEGQGGSKFFCI